MNIQEMQLATEIAERLTPETIRGCLTQIIVMSRPTHNRLYDLDYTRFCAVWAMALARKAHEQMGRLGKCPVCRSALAAKRKRCSKCLKTEAKRVSRYRR